MKFHGHQPILNTFLVNRKFEICNEIVESEIIGTKISSTIISNWNFSSELYDINNIDA